MTIYVVSKLYVNYGIRGIYKSKTKAEEVCFNLNKREAEKTQNEYYEIYEVLEYELNEEEKELPKIKCEIELTKDEIQGFLTYINKYSVIDNIQKQLERYLYEGLEYELNLEDK